MKLCELENELRDGKAVRRGLWSETRSMRSASGELVDHISNGPVQLNLSDLVGDDWTRADGLGRDTADRNEMLAVACSVICDVIKDAAISPGVTKRLQVDRLAAELVAHECDAFLGLFGGLTVRVEGPLKYGSVIFEITWRGERPSSANTTETPPVLGRRLPDERIGGKRDSDSKPEVDA